MEMMGSAVALRLYGVVDDRRAVDRSLVDRIVAGDDVAFARVYDQYSSLVHGIATRLVGRSAAADVCQEVFVQLWERPERYDATCAGLGTFLAVLAHRRSVDLLRRGARRTGNEERGATRALTPAPDVAESAMAMIDAESVRAAVADLPDDQRRAIELAYFDGLTFREVAVVTSTAEGTAKSRLRLGLSKLAASLSIDGAA